MKKHFMILALLGAIVMACSPEDGQDGSVGPQGEQGETGTANVIYSDWIPSGFESNGYESPITGTLATFTIENIEELTDEIESNGFIMVYGRYPKVTEPLPTSYFGSFMQTYKFSIDDHLDIMISVRSIDDSSIGNPIYDDYRYIIIPRGVPSTTGKNTVDYSKMSYEEITTLFNIPE